MDNLAAQGVLHEETARIFRTPAGTPFHLYQHQIEALEKARQGESYVVTSGTGSGKSLTYLLPITENLVRMGKDGENVRLGDRENTSLSRSHALPVFRFSRSPRPLQ